FNASSYNGRTQCSPIYGSSCSNIYKILYNNVSCLWNLIIFPFFIWNKTKTISTNDNPRVNDTIVANGSFGINFYSCKNNRIVPYNHIISNVTIWENFYVVANFYILAYISKGTNINLRPISSRV